MAIRTIGAYIATSDTIPGRRRQLTEEDIRSLAEHAEAGPVELDVNHDEQVTIRALCTKAELRRTDSGALGLWVEHEVDESDLERFGDRFGYSVGYATQAVRADPTSDLPVLQLIVDSENFADDVFEGAIADLRVQFNVSAGWLLQYQELPPPAVIIAIGLQFVASAPWDLAKAALYDVLKSRFMHPRGGTPTVFKFKLREIDPETEKRREISAQVITADPKMLGLALNALEDISANDANRYEFDSSKGKWRQG
ncbi:MAG TPA: hypothetical protein VIK06_07585 [Candidatus Limnocylindrales bacterium]